MTVMRVWGTMDSRYDLELTPGVDDRWEIAVSTAYDVYGWVTVELWAEDDYGNTSYATAIAYAEAGAITCIQMSNDPYSVQMMSDDYTVQDLPDAYTIEYAEEMAA